MPVCLDLSQGGKSPRGTRCSPRTRVISVLRQGCSTQATRRPGWRPIPSQPPAAAPGTGCMKPQARQPGWVPELWGRGQAGGRQLASAGRGRPAPGPPPRDATLTGETGVQEAGPCPSGPLLKPGAKSTHRVQGPAQGLGVRSGPRSTAYLHSLSGIGFNFIFQSYSFQFILQALDFNRPHRVLWTQ